MHIAGGGDDALPADMPELSAIPDATNGPVRSLRFDKIRLAGFKSFVEPTDFLIEPGLTGIVGPNGCGKSNLLEAIRWVMGANSAKAMRAKGMDDVIFSGTKQRPGRASASVTLTIDNSARVAPAAFNDTDELEVIRHIRRGGGSTYKINGRAVRAKDVQLLFADSSTGANSPALVRQGQISELIASKPQNRRRILEEAAGISGLHTRRHEAELRLRAAETNLTRLDDVIGQIEGQLHQLKRQSRQARRYKRLAGEIAEYRALLWHKRWHAALGALQAADAENRKAQTLVAESARAAAELTRTAAELSAQLAPAREEMMIAAAVLARLNAARDTLERDEAAARSEIAGLEATLAQILADTEREEAMFADAQAAEARLAEEYQTLAPLADLAAALAEAETEANAAFQARSDLEALFNEMTRRTADRLARRDSAERARKQAEARRERLGRELAKAQARLDTLGTGPGPDTQNLFVSASQAALGALTDARAEVARLQDEADAGEPAMEARRRELAEARRTLSELEAEAKALAKMLRQTGASTHVPALNRIHVSPGYELALASALGEDLDAAIAEDAPTSWRGATHAAPDFGPGITVLADVVDAPAELESRLRHIAVVDDLSLSLAPGQRAVTREGALRRWDGFAVRAGAPTSAALKLQNQNRLAEIESETASARAAVEAADAAHASARTAWQAAKQTVREARASVPNFEAMERSASAALARFEADSAREASERRGLEDRLDSLRADLREADEQYDQASADLDAIGDVDGLKTEKDALAQRLREARAAADEASARYRSLKSDSEAREARRTAIARERGDWAARGAKASERVAALSTRRADAEARLAGATSGPDPFAERRNTLFAELASAESRQAAASDTLAIREAEAREADSLARDAEKAAGAAREARAGAEARLSAAQDRLEQVRARINETLACEPDGLLARLGALRADNPMPEPDLERRIEKLSAERERLGNVNLRADEESEEQESKLEEINTERADLEAAIAKLREGIDELNQEGRERLLRAFDVVDAHFQRLFTTLFQGGQAELRLTESEDPLHAGLEILAAPPGKEVKAMSLLSGGEQALTATALIFAVFLSNPAPICVLDEVDAPLDDANVARYCDLLDEMSRSTATKFIAITHNPVTMSRMDRLFGVTMAERGVSQLLSVRLAEAEELVAAE